MADFSLSSILPALITATVVGGLAYLGTVRAGAKTEGVLTTKIDDLGHRMGRIETDNADQWKVIRETQADVGWLQGKANGR